MPVNAHLSYTIVPNHPTIAQFVHIPFAICILYIPHFSNTIVVVINLSSPIDCAWIGLVPVMHVATAKWITMFPQGPRELEITIYVGLLIFSHVFFCCCCFFYMYCFLKINIVCVPRKFTDKPGLCVFFGVLTFMSAVYTLAAFFSFWNDPSILLWDHQQLSF